jgi:translation initiation factor 1
MNLDDIINGVTNNDIKKKKMIHIRLQKRSAKKCITIIDGLINILKEDKDHKIKIKEILKIFKKKFACNASVIKNDNDEEAIHIQGDKRTDVVKYLVDNEIILKEDIKIHGY